MNKEEKEKSDLLLKKKVVNDVHPVKKFPGSVEAGIAKMLEYRICVTKRSYNVLKEFRNYTYRQDKEGRWLNEPVDSYNHAIDAVRYVIMNEVLGGERRPVNLSRLGRMAY
jgi:phage terminase large subunit